MRYLLLFLGLTLLTACSDATSDTGQRLDFVGSTRLTSSNRTGLTTPADTLASRVYAEATDTRQILTRLRITVAYAPSRDPFLYPTPLSSLNRDLIDNNPDADFIYLDTLLTSNPRNLLFTSVFGIRSTAGRERWQYELRDPSDNVRASRAFNLSMRRTDSLLTYNDYTLKLAVPAGGTAARRFLHLRAGLALPAYTVLNTQPTLPDKQAALQDSTDLIVQSDGLTISAPDSSNQVFNTTRWPTTRRRATRLYLTSLTASTFTSYTTLAGILPLYTNAAAAGRAIGLRGVTTGQVSAGQVYAFKTGGRIARYGLLLVVSVPTSTTTTTTSGLQLEVRMPK